MSRTYTSNTISRIPFMYKLLIFIPLILFTVFGEYHGLIWILNDICLLFMLFISLKGKYRNKVSIVFISALILILITINIVLKGLYLITLVRIYDIFKGLIYLMFINYLINKYREDCKKFILQDLFYWFNIYFFLNIPVIVKQINLAINRDDIAGLIGYQGTHVVLILWLVLIVINCYKINNTKYFNLIVVLLMIEIVAMIIVSVFSDNTAFYFIGPFVLIYCLSKVNRVYKIFNRTNLIIFTILACGTFYFFVSSEKAMHYLETKVKVKIEQYTSMNNSEVKNEERVEMILYGLNEGQGWYLGKGIGIRYEIMGIKGNEYHKSPIHINMCDLSAMIIEVGIILSLLIIFLYYFIAVNPYKKNKIYILLLVFLLFSYARFISDERMIFLFSIFNLVLVYLVDEKAINEKYGEVYKV